MKIKKKIEEKKISKKNLSATFQIFSKCHFPNFLSPETKCHKMQVILYRMIYKTYNFFRTHTHRQTDQQTNLYTSQPRGAGSKNEVYRYSKESSNPKFLDVWPDFTLYSPWDDGVYFWGPFLSQVLLWGVNISFISFLFTFYFYTKLHFLTQGWYSDDFNLICNLKKAQTFS